MTESRVVHEVRFSDSVTLVDDVSAKAEFEILVDGSLNCARLSSIVEFFPSVNFFGTDTLMPSTIVPLAETVAVSVGDRVRLESKYRHRSDIAEASFRAEIL
jgi:hypothetical protein